MFAPKYRKEQVVVNGGDFGGEYRLKIPRQRRRLEYIQLNVSYTTASLASPTQESHANVIDQVQLFVDDGALRPVVNARGIDLVFLNDQWGLNPFRHNQNFMGSSSTGTSGVLSVLVHYPIWLRHPLIEDPSGIFTGVPMWKLGADAELIVKVAPPSRIASTITLDTNGITITATLYFREDVSDVYLPSQIASFTSGTIPVSSRFEMNFPQGGYLTCWSIATYNNAAATTRGTILGPGAVYELTYGPKQLDTFTDRGMEARRDGFQDNQTNSLASNFMFGDDLLYDLPGVGGYHPRSVLDLDPVPKGDILKLSVSQTVASGTPNFRGAYHKFLANPVEFLRAI